MSKSILRSAPLVLALVASGCGGTRPADHDSAGESLRAALDAWKGGRSPDSLAGETPAVQAADPRWQAGYRLLKYEVIAAPSPSGLDLHCPVDLWLQDPKGKKVRERADYTLTTHPTRTVVRVAF